MKKNTLMRLASCLMVAVLLTTCAISGTFAKYTSEASGSDSATVAKWSIKVGDTEIANATPQTVAFDLFDTIKDSDGSTEADVATDHIAPGTSGDFTLAVKNESEVNATYSLAFTVTNASNIPLEFSTDGGANWETDLTALDITDEAIDMGAAASSTKVQWRWAYSVDAAGDAADTLLGIAAQTTAPTITIQATVTATQVD